MRLVTRTATLPAKLPTKSDSPLRSNTYSETSRTIELASACTISENENQDAFPSTVRTSTAIVHGVPRVAPRSTSASPRSGTSSSSVTWPRSAKEIPRITSTPPGGQQRGPGDERADQLSPFRVPGAGERVRDEEGRAERGHDRAEPSDRRAERKHAVVGRSENARRQRQGHERDQRGQHRADQVCPAREVSLESAREPVRRTRRNSRSDMLATRAWRGSGACSPAPARTRRPRAPAGAFLRPPSRPARRRRATRPRTACRMRATRGSAAARPRGW